MAGFTDFLNYINPILGIAGKFLGGLEADKDQKWNRNTAIDLLNWGRGLQQFGLDRWSDIQGPLRDTLFQHADQGGQFALNNLPGFEREIANFGNVAPDLFQSSGVSPEMAGVFNEIMGNVGALNPSRDLAAQLFAGGGWTPQSGEAFSRLFDIANAQGNVMGSLGDIGGRLVNQEGQTNFTRNLMDRASDVLNGQGFTPGLRTAEGIAGNLAGTDYGATPQLRQLQNIALGRISNPALLPMGQVMSFAKENAGRAISQQYEAAMRRAMARGGGPGAVVGSGSQNQGQAAFADQAAELESQMMIDALMKQQGLQLQEQAQNINLALSPEEIAAKRQLTSLGMFPEITQASTSRAGTFGGLGNQALGQETARLGLGGNLLDQYLKSQLGALGTIQNLIGTQGNYALGAGRLAGDLSQIPMQGAQGALNSLIQAGQLGLNRGTQTGDLLSKLYDLRLKTFGQGADMAKAAFNPLAVLAGQGADIARTGAQIQGAPFGNIGQNTTPNSYWSQLGNIGDLVGAIGKPIGGGGGNG